MNKQEIIESYKWRHATKAFDSNKKISKEDFDFILETAQLSPSSVGLEPWHFLVINNMELRNELVPLTGGGAHGLKDASHFIIALSRKDISYNDKYVSNLLRDTHKMPEEVQGMILNFLESFQASYSTIDLINWSSKQGYIALGNMMSSAAMIGIDSCPIEGFDKPAVNKLLLEKGLFNDNEFEVNYMLALGYRDESKELRAKTRQDINDIVSYI